MNPSSARTAPSVNGEAVSLIPENAPQLLGRHPQRQAQPARRRRRARSPESLQRSVAELTRVPAPSPTNSSPCTTPVQLRAIANSSSKSATKLASMSHAARW